MEQDIRWQQRYEFVQGPNGTLQQAFLDGMISDHDGWRRMAKARVTTSHTYKPKVLQRRFMMNIPFCSNNWI